MDVGLQNIIMFCFVSLLSMATAPFADNFEIPSTRVHGTDTTHSQFTRQCNASCPYVTKDIPGPIGPSGSFGMPGDPGIPGSPGMQGYDGRPGHNATEIGQNGVPGEAGHPGQKGYLGSQGNFGNRGVTGKNGPVGPEGIRGADTLDISSNTPGNIGDVGLDGPRGSKGERGNTGPDGDCLCPVDDEPEIIANNFSAFSVSRHSSLLSTDGVAIITWDHIFTNVGGDFNPETGILTCSIPGYYLFSFHAQKAMNGANPFIQLMLNDYHIVGALEDGDNDDDDSTSNTIILPLETSDQVWLQLYDSMGLHGSHPGFTTFLGYLLPGN